MNTCSVHEVLRSAAKGHGLCSAVYSPHEGACLDVGQDDVSYQTP